MLEITVDTISQISLKILVRPGPKALIIQSSRGASILFHRAITSSIRLPMILITSETMGCSVEDHKLERPSPMYSITGPTNSVHRLSNKPHREDMPSKKLSMAGAILSVYIWAMLWNAVSKMVTKLPHSEETVSTTGAKASPKATSMGCMCSVQVVCMLAHICPNAPARDSPMVLKPWCTLLIALDMESANLVL